jgi:N-acetylglucosaminyldiphosphoundecaprenol N-acetyl-beta-D-mannosaminyltransferase
MSNTVTILGIPVHTLTDEETMHYCRNWLTEDRQSLHQIVTVNPEFLIAARRDDWFREVLRRADLATADGVGITIAARILGSPIHQRLTGVDLTGLIAGMDSPRPRIFLLGAGPGIAGEAAQRLKRDYPGATVVGTFSGSPGEDDFPSILEQLRESGADTLLVAFGAPAQDIWIDKHRQVLAAYGIVIAIGVGGTFDYLSGRVPRAPRVIRKFGLEWLYRLIRQPWRWRRQLALPQFAALVIRERLFGKGIASDRNHGSSRR